METAAASTFSKTVRRGEQPDVLEGAHHAGARDLGGLPGCDVLAPQYDAAAGCALEPGEHVHERRLAGPVRADQPEDTPPLQRQIHAVHGLDRPDVNLDLPRLEGFGGESVCHGRSDISKRATPLASHVLPPIDVRCASSLLALREDARVDEGTLLLLVIAAVSAETGPIA